MGFDINGAKLLIKAKKSGIDFDKVVTIGRQGLHLSHKELLSLIRKAGLQINVNWSSLEGDKYADQTFLKILGAKTTDSIDASDYEGATVIHDMNLPVSTDLKGKYSLVIDGGSLEHVFNFPVAIKNCMELIKPNGYYIGITPANNFFGHGFYQFSPELYFRIFNHLNGFRLMKMYFYINHKRASIYEISDPNEVGQRITLRNCFPSYLFVIAQKMEDKELFTTTPQQSDYENISWKKKENSSTTSKNILLKTIRKIIPKSIFNRALKFYNSCKMILIFRATGISNSRFIKKIK